MGVNFKILSLNCHKRINTKIHLFINLIISQKIDIALFQETGILTEKTKHIIQTTYGMSFYENKGTSISAGVIMILTNKFKSNVHAYDTYDSFGRTQKLVIDIDSEKFTIVNIYAPATYKPRVQFYRELLPKIDKYQVIIGGDFNCLPNPRIDKIQANPRPDLNTQANTDQIELKNYIIQNQLQDIWRIQNPNKLEYTFDNNRGSKSRIDRFILTKDIDHKSTKASILKSDLSDHKPITVTIETRIDHKKSSWKLNNKLLENPNIVKDFKLVWKDWQEHKIYMDPHEWWEQGKIKILHFKRYLQ